MRSISRLVKNHPTITLVVHFNNCEIAQVNGNMYAYSIWMVNGWVWISEHTPKKQELKEIGMLAPLLLTIIDTIINRIFTLKMNRMFVHWWSCTNCVFHIPWEVGVHLRLAYLYLINPWIILGCWILTFILKICKIQLWQWAIYHLRMQPSFHWPYWGGLCQPS